MNTDQSWQRLRSERALEDSPDAVVITTAQLDFPGPEIVYVNPAFCRMTGYHRDELIGATPRILQGPKTDAWALRRLRERLGRGQSVLDTAINYRKDGSAYTVQWSITPVRDEGGRQEYFVSLQRCVDGGGRRDETAQYALDRAPVGMAIVDDQGVIETVNEALCELFGYEREQLLDACVETLVPDELRSKHGALRRGYQAAPEPRLFGNLRDFYAQCRDGSRIPVEIGLAPMESGGRTRILATVVDVSQRKAAERRLASTASRQAALAEFGEMALRAGSLQALLDRAVDLVRAELGFTAAVLMETTARGGPGLVAAAGCDAPESAVDRYALAGDPAAAEALETGAVIPMSAPGLRTLAKRLRVETEAVPQAGLCIPVVEPARQWGVLYALGHAQDEADEARDYLVSVCQIVASAARRHQDRKQVQDAEHMRSLAGRLAHVGGWSADLDAGRLHWSHEVCLIHEEVSGKQVTIAEAMDYYAPEARHRIRRLFQACAEEAAAFDDELDIITAKGRRRTVRTIGEAVRDDAGVIRQVRGALQDVTERRRTERNLLQSQERLRQLADAMPGIVWTATADGTIDYANQTFFEYTGISNDQLARGAWVEAVHPDDQDRVLEAWREAIAGERDYQVDFRIYSRADGKYRWHYVGAVPIRDEGGVLRKWYGSAIDVHERKDLEEELVRVASRLTTTLESITDGFYTLDDHWRITYFNAEAENLMRTDRSAVLGVGIWEAFPGFVGTMMEVEHREAFRGRQTRHFEFYAGVLETWLSIHVYPSESGLTVHFRDITEHKHSEADIAFLAFYDQLTELPNRRNLQDRLSELVMECRRSNQYATLILVNLDHFKTLNDTLGPGHGDRFLRSVAARLQASFGEAGTIARIGGDEFAIAMAGLGSTADEALEAASDAARGVQEVLRAPHALEAADYQRTCSIGLTLIDPAGDKGDDVIKRADLALFHAKNEGRDHIRAFDASLQEQADLRLRVEQDMPRGLREGEFIPYYQQIVGCEGECLGAEALVRWQHPERGMVSPAEFIPVAEESGLIHDLGEAMLRQVCWQLVEWSRHRATAGLVCSVNVSARQFRSVGFVDGVRGIVEETGVNPARLRLEVTESLLVDDVEATIQRMDVLRAAGITFALDDFGTGYSSLAYLKRLPLDVLKIDQSFVLGLPGDQDDAAIVQTIVALAGSMGLDCIAEGVETDAIQQYLTREGCRRFQGYLHSRPLPAKAFEAALGSTAG